MSRSQAHLFRTIGVESVRRRRGANDAADNSDALNRRDRRGRGASLADLVRIEQGANQHNAPVSSAEFSFSEVTHVDLAGIG
jgi:hypothetical protein